MGVSTFPTSPFQRGRGVSALPLHSTQSKLISYLTNHSCFQEIVFQVTHYLTVSSLLPPSLWTPLSFISLSLPFPFSFCYCSLVGLPSFWPLAFLSDLLHCHVFNGCLNPTSPKLNAFSSCPALLCRLVFTLWLITSLSNQMPKLEMPGSFWDSSSFLLLTAPTPTLYHTHAFNKVLSAPQSINPPGTTPSFHPPSGDHFTSATVSSPNYCGHLSNGSHASNLLLCHLPHGCGNFNTKT